MTTGVAGPSTVARSAMRSFLALIRESGWDILCHHAADVTNYKSPDFDTIGGSPEQHPQPASRARDA